MVLYDYRQRYPSAIQALEEVQQLTGATRVVAPVASPQSVTEATQVITPAPTQTANQSAVATTIFSDQTVSQAPPLRRRLKFLRTKALALGTIVVLLGSAMVSVASPHIQLLCTVLNNCSRDIQFQAIADEAQANAVNAQTAAERAQTQSNLKTAHDSARSRYR